jgi:parvulin-like peptidyl-prolyl isomerase
MRRALLLLLSIGMVLSVQALADEAPPSADEARRAKVFAKVGPTTITVGDLEDAIALRRPYAKKRLVEHPERIKELADTQLENELFYQGAQELGYADDPAVQRFVAQTLVKVYVRKEFEETVTPDDVPAEQVVKYYEDHPDEFRRPEMRRARHILLASKEEAEELLKILQVDKNETFRALAKKRSIDTETNVRGGDLLYFTADGKVVGREASGTVDGTLVKAAYGLDKTGAFAGPLDLGDGKWSVLELTGIRPERVQTLDKASGHIQRKLWREEREAALDAKIAELREEVKPEVYPERMDAIVFERPSEPDPAKKP